MSIFDIHSSSSSKVYLSEQGQEVVTNKLEEKGTGWNKGSNSKAISEASKYLVKMKICELLKVKKITEDTTLKIEQLERLATGDIFTDNNKNKDNSGEEKIKTYIKELKKENKTETKVKDLLQFIQNQSIHWKGISYANWKNFYQGKKIAQYIFDAYCHVLEIDKNEYKKLVHQDIAKKFSSRKSVQINILVNRLSTFNHKEQINLFKEKLNQERRIFLINNSCLYSRTWMLKCLEQGILSSICGVEKCFYFPQQYSSYISSGVKGFKDNLSREFPNIEKNPKRLKNILSNQHILFVIDINEYDLQSLKKLINILQPFVEITNEKQGGRLIMFLLARGNNNNDWLDGKWNNNDTLSSEICELKPANPFSSEKHIEQLAEVIRDIRLNGLQEEESSKKEKDDEVARNLIDKSIMSEKKYSTKNLLLEIYQHFNCGGNNNDFAPTWERYP